MLKNLYTDISIYITQAEFYFNELDTDQIPITHHQFPSNNLQIEGKIEFLDMNKPYISGRHIFKDNLVYKGVGSSKFYNLEKKRDILGGMTFNSALREYINSRVLGLNNLTNTHVKGLGHLKDLPDHHFIVRTHKYPRLGFVTNCKLSAHDINEIKLLYNTRPTNTLNSFINRFFNLLFNGVLHSSMNEFNFAINGDIIDFESFYLAHSKTNICIPVTLDVTNVNQNDFQAYLEKNLKNKTLTHHYVSNFLSVLTDVLIPFLSNVYKTDINLNKLLVTNPNWIYYKNFIEGQQTETRIIEVKDVYDRKFVYAELISKEPFISELKHKKLIKLGLNSNFQTIAKENPIEIITDIFSKTGQNFKTKVLNSLTKLLEDDSNILCARVAGSLATPDSRFDNSSDIDLYLEVKKNRLFYKEYFKNFLIYPIDIVIKEQLDNKPHLKWHILTEGLTLKGIFEPNIHTDDFSNYVTYTLKNCEHILNSIRKEQLNETLDYPAPNHFFKGYLIPLEKDVYSLRYIETLVAFYSFQTLYYSDIFCPSTFKKNLLIKDFLDFFPSDSHWDLIKEIYDLITVESRVVNGKRSMKKLIPITTKMIALEKSCLKLARLHNAL